MKKYLFTLFKILVIAVLIAKISNWFFNYSDKTNKLINTYMFCLIGFAYLVGSTAWQVTLNKLIFLICGLYLIVMNFLPQHTALTIVGIICILVPMLIAKFSKEVKTLE